MGLREASRSLELCLCTGCCSVDTAEVLGLTEAEKEADVLVVVVVDVAGAAAVVVEGTDDPNVYECQLPISSWKQWTAPSEVSS